MDNMTKVLIKNKLLTFQFKDTGLDKKRFDKKKKLSNLIPIVDT